MLHGNSDAPYYVCTERQSPRHPTLITVRYRYRCRYRCLTTVRLPAIQSLTRVQRGRVMVPAHPSIHGDGCNARCKSIRLDVSCTILLAYVSRYEMTTPAPALLLNPQPPLLTPTGKSVGCIYSSCMQTFYSNRTRKFLTD